MSWLQLPAPLVVSLSLRAMSQLWRTDWIFIFAMCRKLQHVRSFTASQEYLSVCDFVSRHSFTFLKQISKFWLLNSRERFSSLLLINRSAVWSNTGGVTVDYVIVQFYFSKMETQQLWKKQTSFLISFGSWMMVFFVSFLFYFIISLSWPAHHLVIFKWFWIRYVFEPVHLDSGHWVSVYLRAVTHRRCVGVLFVRTNLSRCGQRAWTHTKDGTIKKKE